MVNNIYKKDFDTWNEKKKLINSQSIDSDFFVLEGEIWWTSIGINIGHEINGKHTSKRLLRLAGGLNSEEFDQIRNRIASLLIKPNPP